MMTKEEAIEKLMEMFPEEYVSVKYSIGLDKHFGFDVETDEEYSIYIANLGFLYGSSFEECFEKL